MKNYKFVKLEDEKLHMKHGWILEATDISTILEHTDKYMSTVIEKGIQDYFRNQKYHPNTDWRGMIESMAKIQESTPLSASILLENKVLQGKIKTFLKFGVIYLRENGSYMTTYDGLSETDVIFQGDKMIYPNYTKDDIKVRQWDKGVHYYATIGNFNVTQNGVPKWSTYDKAYEVALKYLKEKF